MAKKVPNQGRRVQPTLGANDQPAGSVVDDSRYKALKAENAELEKQNALQDAILTKDQLKLENLKNSGAEQTRINKAVDQQNKALEAKFARDQNSLKLKEKESREEAKLLDLKNKQAIIDKKEEDRKQRVASINKEISTQQKTQITNLSLMSKAEKQIAITMGVHKGAAAQIQDLSRLKTVQDKEQAKILRGTIDDRGIANELTQNMARSTAEIFGLQKKMLPHEDKILAIQQERAALQAKGIETLTHEEQLRIGATKELENSYKMLQKAELMNEKLVDLQSQAKDLIFEQNNAFGSVMTTLKDIITNPLVIFTGLLALGVARYEEMRQRGNQLAEEQDRINKALAGAGPYQEKILARASLIRAEFNAAGEGFASSLEGAVGAVQALEKQLGNIDFVSGKLVKTMSKLKLSIGLSDEESAKVLDTFMTMSNLSEDAAISASKVTYQMAETVGLNPAAVFQDIAAASAETLAHFSGGAQAIAKSAVEARRMGLTLQDVATISKGLLDFETSIEAEMEAQMLTGMDINFNKARMFAMNKQGDKAAEEVMRQVGGLQRFQKMNIFQQEAIAKATGLDLNTLLKSNVQREREAKQLRDKDKLVGKQLTMSIEVTKMMGKLDAGLGIMQQIGVVLGDIFLDVFNPALKEGENLLLGFIKGDKFKNVVTTILKGIKSVMNAVVSIFQYISNSAPFKALSNYFGGGSGPDKDQLSADRIGTAVKIGLGTYGLLKLGSFLKPMYVKVVGGLGGMFGGKGMPGGMGGTGTFGGMNLGSMLGGTASKGSMAMGGTALGTAGTVLGGVLGLAAIGKGVYDVATIKDTDTGRDKAKDYGGLGGAATGALTGAAIGSVVPVVGTILGAGVGAVIGYFGGRAVGSMDAFRDDIDVMRDQMVENQEDITASLNKRMEVNNRRMMLKNSMATESFLKLSNEAGDVTGDALKQLQTDLVDTGFISKEMFRQMAKDGKVTQGEMNRMLKTITGDMGKDKDFDRNANKEQNEAYDSIEDISITHAANKLELENDLKALEEYEQKLSSFAPVTEIRGTNTKFPMDKSGGYYEDGSHGGSAGYASNYMTDDVSMDKFLKRVMSQFKMTVGSDALTADQWDGILKAMEKRRYDNMDDDKTVNQALTDVSDLGKELVKSQLGKNLLGVENIITDLNTATQDVVTITTENVQEVDSLIKATEANTIELNKSSELLQEQQVKAATNKTAYHKGVDAVVTDPGFNVLLKVLPLLMGFEKGGVLPKKSFNSGGVLYGGSHAQGGIPTRFGELEGGEAVINKRSTAMHAGLLSQINQSGGGTSFASGGMLGIGPHTAGMKHAGGFIGVLPEALKMFNVPLPKILDGVAGFGYKTAEKYGAKKGLKSQGYLDGSEDYDDVQKGMGYTSTAIDVASVGAAAIKYGKPLINLMRPGLISTAFSGAAASTLGFLGPASWALLLAQIAYTAWKNKHDEAQKELHNHGGLTENEYAVLESQLAGAVDIHNPTDIPYSGQTAMMHGLSQDQIVPSTSTYEQFDAHGRPFSQLHKGEHWIPSVPGRDAGYKSDRGNNMFFPDAYIDTLMSNMGAQGTDVQAGLTRTAYLDQMLYMAKAGQAKGVTHGEVSRYATNPEDTTRYHALTATPDLPGYGYKDIYGFGPKKGRTGYALKDNAAFYEFWNYDDMEMQYPESKARGGVLSNSPIKRVNDMILTKDGQMIQTASDDNIIAKKGGITQKTGGGGSSRVEALLEGILNAVQESGDTYIDGAKVSAAINSANYRA